MILPILALAAASVVPSAAAVQFTITVPPARKGATAPASLTPGDLMLYQGEARVPVFGLERLPANQSDLQLFIVLDDSTRSSSLGLQLPELKKWIASLPAGAQVAIGYIRNGGADVVQPFTTDRQKAAAALRLPEAIPGVNASPYFAISNLTRHWPSGDLSARRTLLLFTDGVDRYFDDPQIIDDPYVDAAVDSATENRVSIYTVYLRGTGRYGEGPWGTTMAESRLLQVSGETGGYSYQELFTDPVSIHPFLTDFSARLANQYRVTFEASGGQGFQPIKLRTELPNLQIAAPVRVYVP